MGEGAGSTRYDAAMPASPIFPDSELNLQRWGVANWRTVGSCWRGKRRPGGTPTTATPATRMWPHRHMSLWPTLWGAGFQAASFWEIKGGT